MRCCFVLFLFALFLVFLLFFILFSPSWCVCCLFVVCVFILLPCLCVCVLLCVLFVSLIPPPLSQVRRCCARGRSLSRPSRRHSARLQRPPLPARVGQTRQLAPPTGRRGQANNKQQKQKHHLSLCSHVVLFVLFQAVCRCLSSRSRGCSSAPLSRRARTRPARGTRPHVGQRPPQTRRVTQKKKPLINSLVGNIAVCFVFDVV
jgi:hypothetical protein